MTRNRSSVAIAVGAGVAVLAPSTPALADDVGTHGNIYKDADMCVEARNHLEESHNRTSGFGTHVYGKTDSTWAAIGTPEWFFGHCPGIAYGKPAGWLYSSYSLYVWKGGEWRLCIQDHSYSSANGQWSERIGTDTGDKAPCIPSADKKGYWYLNVTSHYVWEDSAWRGGSYQSGMHIFHNK